MTSTFWVIRHKPTGGIMPDFHRGTTHWLPLAWQGKGRTRIPKLFLSKRSAKCSARWWVNGPTRAHYINSEWGPEFDGTTTESAPYRKMEDLEILPAHLTIQFSE